MLTEGKHKVTIIGSFCGESPEKKTPYVGLELETETGEFIDWVAWLTEKTQMRYLDTLKKAGWVGKKLSDLASPKYSIDELFVHNPKLTAEIEYEEYTNKDGETKKKPVVKWLNTGSFGPVRADHAKAVKMFDGSKFDGIMKELQGSLKPKSSPAQEFKASADDVPF